MSILLQPRRIFILILLVSFATLSGILFTPGIPQMAKEFSLSPANIQWIMSIFLLGYCIGLLPYGPIANRIGRKKTIYLGLAISFVGCAMVYVAESFFVLCLGRFIQAFGSSAGLKVVFTMISDLHAGQKATKVIGYISVAFAIVSGVGVAIGGFITSAFGWRGNFAALLIYTIFLFLWSLGLPETSKKLMPDALKIKNIAQGYIRQFKDSFLVLHALLMGLATTTAYIFATQAPSIAIDIMGMTPDQYGLFNLIPALGMAGGLIQAARLAGKIKPRIAMISGILLFLVGILVMSLCFAKGWVNGWSLFLPTSLVFFGGWFLWVYASSTGLSESTDKSNASAVFQFINIGTAMIGTYLAGTLGTINVFTLPIAFGIIMLIMLSIWLSLREHHRKSGHA